MAKGWARVNALQYTRSMAVTILAVSIITSRQDFASLFHFHKDSHLHPPYIFPISHLYTVPRPECLDVNPLRERIWRSFGLSWSCNISS